jgi:hypothetical protein
MDPRDRGSIPVRLHARQRSRLPTDAAASELSTARIWPAARCPSTPAAASCCFLRELEVEICDVTHVCRRGVRARRPRDGEGLAFAQAVESEVAVQVGVANRRGAVAAETASPGEYPEDFRANKGPGECSLAPCAGTGGWSSPLLPQQPTSQRSAHPRAPLPCSCGPVPAARRTQQASSSPPRRSRLLAAQPGCTDSGRALRARFLPAARCSAGPCQVPYRLCRELLRGAG